ncbi:MAG: hypothetical protein M1814_002391 [Vezdaea aestivalis]|nr:MAG: hypothetical protein M1814_002391 [Vezdaea aestivalis]
MEYLIRMTQYLETFRRPEIEALAVLANIEVQFLQYSDKNPFCTILLKSEEDAKILIDRSILSKSIFELWGTGSCYEDLHRCLKETSYYLWPLYRHCSFKFEVDPFQHRRTASEQNDIIESFSYLGFEGPIRMKSPDERFCIFEEFEDKTQLPKKLYFGRYIASGARDELIKYDLKKRKYISTTSMDAELALVTANMALASPGRLFLDPFVGTGSFLVACSHFGASTFGSDIDGRSIRGKSMEHSLRGNFVQYHLDDLLFDTIVSDLTNSPLRTARWLDGILCDPPYGVREGLKVLGSREPTKKTPIIINGKPAYLQPDYVPPKRPYSFLQMLDDILDFAAQSLVDNGRLSMWMPTANEDIGAIDVPSHPLLEVLSISTQSFTKWSRRLITYRRLQSGMDITDATPSLKTEVGRNADDLNFFRKKEKELRKLRRMFIVMVFLNWEVRA